MVFVSIALANNLRFWVTKFMHACVFFLFVFYTALEASKVDSILIKKKMEIESQPGASKGYFELPMKRNSGDDKRKRLKRDRSDFSSSDSKGNEPLEIREVIFQIKETFSIFLNIYKLICVKNQSSFSFLRK